MRDLVCDRQDELWPVARENVMARDVACIVCDSDMKATRYASTFAGSANDARDYFLSCRKQIAHGRIVSCLSCGLVYTSPQFMPVEYDSIYRELSQRRADAADFE